MHLLLVSLLALSTLRTSASPLQQQPILDESHPFFPYVSLAAPCYFLLIPPLTIVTPPVLPQRRRRRLRL